MDTFIMGAYDIIRAKNIVKDIIKNRDYVKFFPIDESEMPIIIKGLNKAKIDYTIITSLLGDPVVRINE